MKRDPISPRVNDAKRTIILFRFATALLDAIIIFSVFAILLLFFHKDVTLALIPTAIYLFIRSFVLFQNVRAIEKVTKKYPTLDERLQTAYDNRRESSVLAERLISDVSRRLDEMHSSSFLEKKEFSVRIFLVIFLVFAMLSVNFLYLSKFGSDLSDSLLHRGGGISADSSDGSGDGDRMDAGAGKNWEQSQYGNKKEKNKIGAQAGGQAPGFNEGPIPGTGGGTGTSDNANLYGAPSTARIEGQNVQMEVHPEYGGEVEISDEAAAKGERDFQLPEEIEASRTPEQEPVEYQEVIRNYFDKLSRGG